MVRGGILRVAVVGGGPRGASAVERLLAVHAQRPAPAHDAVASPGGRPTARAARLEITVYDPFSPGPGKVWRMAQPRLFVMNTQSFYPTLIPSEPGLAPPLAGGSFDAWREAQRAAIDAGTCTLAAEEQAELKGLESRDFPPRALYGRYLAQTWDAVLAAAPPGTTVRHVSAEVARVGRTPHGFAVTCANGRAQEADAVVLALGHVPAQPSAEQSALADAAAHLGLHYLPPAAPADVDWDRLPAGETVLVRGMGLNFFDVMAALTEGRGGRFAEGHHGRLVYAPSGREPHLVAASRRGVPYRGKAELDAYYAPSVELRWLTRAAALAPRQAGIQPSFDQDLWPLLHRDTLWAYYSTLARVEPAAVSEGFLEELSAALAVEGPGWEPRASEVVHDGVVPARRLDLRALGAPLAGWHAADRAELDARVLAYLDEDAAGSARGENDPVKMAIAALHRGRAVLKEAVADGGITEASWVSGLRGWFEGLAEGLASGPPPSGSGSWPRSCAQGSWAPWAPSRVSGWTAPRAASRPRRRGWAAPRSARAGWSRPSRPPTPSRGPTRRCCPGCWPTGWCARASSPARTGCRSPPPDWTSPPRRTGRSTSTAFRSRASTCSASSSPRCSGAPRSPPRRTLSPPPARRMTAPRTRAGSAPSATRTPSRGTFWESPPEGHLLKVSS
ncbi:FAD/NAD(P)-binding protein [Sinomonas atrocyanea]